MKRWTAMFLAGVMLMLTACGQPAAEPTVSVEPAPAPTEGFKEPWALRREKMTQAEAEKGPEQLVTLKTRLGTVQGVQQEGYREFRGVRYAVAERWQDAVAITEPWDGVYDATQWGDQSLQYRGFYGKADSLINQFYADESLVTFPAGYSEDSLNLNIWTPDAAKNCPVLLYIHGGSFVTGSNVDPSTDGEAYANHGIITVAINYRLGPFANLYGDGYNGNLALTDQLTAIRWVRDNIADYGGDPSRITIMGESAGAISVQDLLISPLVEEGLIAGAIMLSAGGSMSAMGSPTTSAMMGAVWDQVKSAAGAEHISNLTALSDRELFELWNKNLGGYAAIAANPILNGVSLVDDVNTSLGNGSVKDVPTMIGMLSNDMMPYMLYQAATDYGQKRAAAGGEPVYLYYFDRCQPGDDAGAFHAADLYYVFGTLYRNWRPFEDTDFRIADDMIDYVSNFVKTGDPNGDGLAQWEPAGESGQRFLHFGDEKAAMITVDPAKILENQMAYPMFPMAKAVKEPAE